jgi:hypothetical protein
MTADKFSNSCVTDQLLCASAATVRGYLLFVGLQWKAKEGPHKQDLATNFINASLEGKDRDFNRPDAKAASDDLKKEKWLH